jgi:hypothetical protein
LRCSYASTTKELPRRILLSGFKRNELICSATHSVSLRSPSSCRGAKDEDYQLDESKLQDGDHHDMGDSITGDIGTWGRFWQKQDRGSREQSISVACEDLKDKEESISLSKVHHGLTLEAQVVKLAMSWRRWRKALATGARLEDWKLADTKIMNERSRIPGSRSDESAFDAVQREVTYFRGHK